MPTPTELAHLVEQLYEAQWYDFLDELDAISRRRRDRHRVPDSPQSFDRESVAAWIASRHFLTESGLREVWFLDHGALNLPKGWTLQRSKCWRRGA